MGDAPMVLPSRSPGVMADGLRVLFLCSANSARSQMAEAILRHLARGRITTASAGVRPTARVHPMAIAALETLGVDATGLTPKSIDALPVSSFNIVVTLCDSAREECPVLPGTAKHLHWNFADPALTGGTEEERQRAFTRVASELMTRMRLWLALPLRNRNGT